jgi:hypothetical protein
LGYLAWHALADIDVKLKWFADVAWARRRLETQGMASGTPARACDFPSRPIALVGQVNSLLIGDVVVPGSEEAARLCRDMDRARSVGRSRTLARLPRELSFVAFQMRQVSGWRARLWYVWHALADPRDALVLGGRELPALIYALIGPFLALWRYLRR